MISQDLTPFVLFPSEWIDALPDWLTLPFFENPVWKWILIVLTLLFGSIVFVLIWLVVRRVTLEGQQSKHKANWLRILPPAIGWGFAKLADEIIDEQVNAVGFVDSAIEITLWTLAMICSAWFIISLGGAIANSISRSLELKSMSVNSYLTTIVVRILSLIIAVWLVLDGLEGLGISLLP